MLDFLGKWKDKIVHEAETRIDLVKLGLIERVSKLMSYFILILISIFVGVTILIIMGLGIGEYFAALTGSYVAGYFIAAGIYALIFVLLFVFKTNITNFFAGVFVRVLTNDDDDDDDK